MTVHGQQHGWSLIPAWKKSRKIEIAEIRDVLFQTGLARKDEKGNLKPFEQKREEMINFHVQENNVTRKEAEKLIDKLMKRMPAWGKYYDH